MSGRFVNCGLLVTLGFLQFTAAQEPNGKPEAPVPKAIQASTPISRNSSAGAASKKTAREADTVGDLPALAASIAAYIFVAGCQPKTCSVLVTDFTLPDGDTSAYGMQLADTLSRESTNKEYKLRVIDRSLLQSFLVKERVPAQPDHRAVINWISDALDVRFIVFGTTEKIGNGLVSLSSQLIDTASKDWPVYSAIVNLGPMKPGENLEPVEPFAPLPAITTSASGENIERMGVNGVTIPSCVYMPNPPYSDGARKLKIIGTVTAEAIVNLQGTLENIRIVRGLPGGVNETTIATMRSWRCHPALKDGKPVPVVVPFTVTFRLY
jgi:TonB family protein